MSILNLQPNAEADLLASIQGFTSPTALRATSLIKTIRQLVAQIAQDEKLVERLIELAQAGRDSCAQRTVARIHDVDLESAVPARNQELKRMQRITPTHGPDIATQAIFMVMRLT